MLRLGSVMYSIVSTTLIGIFMVIALVVGFDTTGSALTNLIYASVAAGLIVGFPLTYYVTAKLMKIKNEKPHV